MQLEATSLADHINTYTAKNHNILDYHDNIIDVSFMLLAIKDIQFSNISKNARGTAAIIDNFVSDNSLLFLETGL